MANRIKNLTIFDAKLDPAGAEIVVVLSPEHLHSITQVRGRLLGPRCVYSTTVEVAYPLREQSREYESTGTPRCVMRVIIPEPCFWDPESPFLYQGPVELWQSSEMCERRQISHGLRTIRLGRDGLGWNGRPLTLRGVEQVTDLRPEASRLRQTRCNLLIAPVLATQALVWDAADELGFLMIGRIVNREGLAVARDLEGHPSCLGWLLAPELLENEVAAIVAPTLLAKRGLLVGAELQRPLAAPLPEGISFVACGVELLPQLENLSLPKLVLVKHWPAEASAWPGILGWVHVPG